MKVRYLAAMAAVGLVAGCQSEPVSTTEPGELSQAQTVAPAAPPAASRRPETPRVAAPTRAAPKAATPKFELDLKKLRVDAATLAKLRHAAPPALPSSPRVARMQKLSSEFPWLNANGGVWMGTGDPDPEPLRSVSDEEMLARTRVSGAPDDRLNALVSVGRRKMPGALDALEIGLNPSEPTIVRQLSVSGLVEHGGTEALALMWKAFKDPDVGVRGPAVWAIALYGTDEALKGILAGLADPEPNVQGMAVLAVWAIKDRPEAMEILSAAAASDEILVYQEAASVLPRMGTARALDLLQSAAFSTSDPTKRSMMAGAARDMVGKYPELLLE